MRNEDALFARPVIEQGLATPEQIEECLNLARRAGRPLGQITGNPKPIM